MGKGLFPLLFDAEVALDERFAVRVLVQSLRENAKLFLGLRYIARNCLRLVKFTFAPLWWRCFFFTPGFDESV